MNKRQRCDDEGCWPAVLDNDDQPQRSSPLYEYDDDAMRRMIKILVKLYV